MPQIVCTKIAVLEWEFDVCGHGSMYALLRTNEPRLFQVAATLTTRSLLFALMFLTLFSLAHRQPTLTSSLYLSIFACLIHLLVIE